MRTPTSRVAGTGPCDAAELGWVLQGCCRLGIRARASGWCIGELEAPEIAIAGEGLSVTFSRGKREDRRRKARLRRHRAAGHDEGCASIGVPLKTLRTVARGFGAPDAASYLLEGLEEAIQEIGERGPWSATAAAESVAYAIGRRITPRAPSGTRKAAPLTRSRRGLPVGPLIRSRGPRRSRLPRDGS